VPPPPGWRRRDPDLIVPVGAPGNHTKIVDAAGRGSGSA
jgi:hypothetical protein